MDNEYESSPFSPGSNHGTSPFEYRPHTANGNFATEHLSEMDEEELQATLAHSKKQKRILTIALICLLLLLIPISIWIFTEGERHRGYYYSDIITEYDTPQPQLIH